MRTGALAGAQYSGDSGDIVSKPERHLDMTSFVTLRIISSSLSIVIRVDGMMHITFLLDQ